MQSSHVLFLGSVLGFLQYLVAGEWVENDEQVMVEMSSNVEKRSVVVLGHERYIIVAVPIINYNSKPPYHRLFKFIQFLCVYKINPIYFI